MVSATSIHATALVLNNLFCQINPYHVPVVIAALSKFEQKYSNEDLENSNVQEREAPFQENYNPTGNDFKPSQTIVPEKSALSFKNEVELFKPSQNFSKQSPKSDSSQRKKTKLRFTVKPEG